jgi:hypothetical protein
LERDHGWYEGEARRQMVEQRHLLVESLAAGHSREQIEAHLSMIVKIQNAIGVIDRVSRERHGNAGCDAESPSGRGIVSSRNSVGAAPP